jgi:hypothetical protein
MMTAGEAYLEELAGLPPKTFSSHFASSAKRLRLGTFLERTELTRLYEAAYLAALCKIAINGQGGCGGIIKPERESNRRRLETEFMTARDKLYACAGWQALRPFVKHAVQRIFLRVFVNEDNLAM